MYCKMIRLSLQIPTCINLQYFGSQTSQYWQEYNVDITHKNCKQKHMSKYTGHETNLTAS